MKVKSDISVFKFKYNGKELDAMHGLNEYDYHARQMDPIIGQFNSMDPLCEKYYHISPYAYCAGNPVRYVDPTGMFFGDYYNMYGDWLGTDNLNDGFRYIIKESKEAKQIKKEQKQNGSFKPAFLTSKVKLPSDAAIKATVDVYGRTIKNGDKFEETSIVMKNGDVVNGEHGTLTNATLPVVDYSSAEASIHSHPGDNGDATRRSPEDAAAFTNFGTNIIVGRLGEAKEIHDPNTISTTPKYELQPHGAAFYNSIEKMSYLTLKISSLKKIIKSFNK